jgi:hypothetical protein
MVSLEPARMATKRSTGGIVDVSLFEMLDASDLAEVV